MGKVLRIDVDTQTGDLEYGIPADNPFLNDTEATPELYALGLRNPWKAAMDSGDRSTGEEIDSLCINNIYIYIYMYIYLVLNLCMIHS